VLSGFVLTRRYFEIGDRLVIARGIIKRWPRLMGPVLVTVLVSWSLFQFNLYYFREAAVVLQNSWLASTPISETNPTLTAALAQGTITTFIFGNNSFNGPLSTMRVEFIGSFYSFGLALLVKPLPKWQGLVLVAVVTIVLARVYDPNIVTFSIGVALAAFFPVIRLSRATALIAVGVGVYLLNYVGFRPAYCILLNAFGAALLIFAIERSFFAGWLSNPGMKILGEFSFPIYLIHVPVICSAGTAIFLASGSQVLATASSGALAVVAAVPLVWFNSKWLAIINDWTTKTLVGLKFVSPAARAT
jgi:peptidoglycan/LPS O-acetylase OafA/YrhL